MQNVVKHEIVAVLVLGHILDQLWTVSPYSLYCLKDIDFAVLYDLLDARIGRTINPGTAATIGRDNTDGSIVLFVAPDLDHIH